MLRFLTLSVAINKPHVPKVIEIVGYQKIASQHTPRQGGEFRDNLHWPFNGRPRGAFGIPPLTVWPHYQAPARNAQTFW